MFDLLRSLTPASMAKSALLCGAAYGASVVLDIAEAIADPAHVSDPVTDGRGLILAFGIATIVVTLLWLAAARVTPLIAGRIKRFGVWDDPHQDAHLIGSDVVRYQIHGDDHV